MQPLFVGLLGTPVSLLLAVSGVALWRRWATARRLVIVIAILTVVFHGYAALPPHRNVGWPALIIGAGYGLTLLGITLFSGERK